MRDNLSRRRFLLGLAVAGPAGSLAVSNGAFAEDLPVLTMDDPLAVGLQYTESAVDSASPLYKPGSTCANCMQIRGNEGDAFRPCAVIPGKKVNSLGWCSAWTAKA